MFPFSQLVNPGVRSHPDPRIAFFNYLSTSLLGTFQSLYQANLRFSQTMLEASMKTSQRMLANQHASDVTGAPETLRACQQRPSTLAAIPQQHEPEAARTAHALKKFRDPFQKEGMQRCNGIVQAKANPQSAREGAGASLQFEVANELAHDCAHEAAHERAGACMQFDSLADKVSCFGNVQGPVARPAPQ
ncbi:MAG: phasin family protein [Alphaproteobacteria bacterium]|nr:MAG: phasin family protein [Alphaproteobacteria bacterium]